MAVLLVVAPIISCIVAIITLAAGASFMYHVAEVDHTTSIDVTKKGNESSIAIMGHRAHGRDKVRLHRPLGDLTFVQGIANAYQRPSIGKRENQKIDAKLLFTFKGQPKPQQVPILADDMDEVEAFAKQIIDFAELDKRHPNHPLVKQSLLSTEGVPVWVWPNWGVPKPAEQKFYYFSAIYDFFLDAMLWIYVLQACLCSCGNCFCCCEGCPQGCTGCWTFCYRNCCYGPWIRLCDGIIGSCLTGEPDPYGFRVECCMAEDAWNELYCCGNPCFPCCYCCTCAGLQGVNWGG